jgi:hypothetical protein
LGAQESDSASTWLLKANRFGIECALTLNDERQAMVYLLFRNNNLSVLMQIVSGLAISIKPLSD